MNAKTFSSFYRQYQDWSNPESDLSNLNVWLNTICANYFEIKAYNRMS